MARWFRRTPVTVRKSQFGVEMLEDRALPAPLPVLMVIADQKDFYFQEYNDTRLALQSKGVPVTIAATTTNPSIAHANSGQGTGSGIVTPNIALNQVDSADYSAIAFVGGWGSSMYQYAFNDPNADGKADNFYNDPFYNGDSNINDGSIAPQKVVVNNLINQFLAADKPVAAICHGTTVLAWARVNGVSPISGKNVVTSHQQATPAMVFNSTSYPIAFNQGQYIQALANGAIVSPFSGTVGNPTTTADDVVVDGRIITAENQFSSTAFGLAIAREVNQAPTAIQGPGTLTVAEGSTGTLATFASTDPEGLPLTWSINAEDVPHYKIDIYTGDLIPLGTADYPFAHAVRITATDAHGAATHKWVDIQGLNAAPTAASLAGPSQLIVGEEGTFTLQGVSDVAADLATMKYSFATTMTGLAKSYQEAVSFSYKKIILTSAGPQAVFARAYDNDGGISNTVSFTVNVLDAPTVSSVSAGFGGLTGDTTQRSRINTIQFNFTQPLPEEAVGGFYLDQVAPWAPAASLPIGSGGTLSATFLPGTAAGTIIGLVATISPTASGPGIEYGSLADGIWQLKSTRHDVGHLGNGLFRFYGDADGDGAVSGNDFLRFGNAFNSNDARFDFDDDGIVSGSDLLQLGNRFGRSI